MHNSAQATCPPKLSALSPSATHKVRKLIHPSQSSSCPQTPEVKNFSPPRPLARPQSAPKSNRQLPWWRRPTKHDASKTDTRGQRERKVELTGGRTRLLELMITPGAGQLHEIQWLPPPLTPASLPVLTARQRNKPPRHVISSEGGGGGPAPTVSRGSEGEGTGGGPEECQAAFHNRQVLFFGARKIVFFFYYYDRLIG